MVRSHGKAGYSKTFKKSRTQEQSQNFTRSTTLSFSNPATAEKGLKRTEAEFRMAVLTASANVPSAFHDQLSPTIRSFFPD